MLLLLVLLASSVHTMSSNSVSKTSYLKTSKNCKDLQDQGVNITGVYSIKPDASKKPFFVYCDMETRGGGWLYFLNRIDGSQDFAVPWKYYKSGFGNVAGEFWLGLERLHLLTGNDEVNELLVELVDWKLKKYHIHYKAFSIASEQEYYRLQVLGGYSGDLGDSLIYHAGSNFSTIDLNNDRGLLCSKSLGGGGWWYTSCVWSYLTGKYYSGEGNYFKGIRWDSYRGANLNFNFYSFKEARMMIRPKNFFF